MRYWPSVRSRWLDIGQVLFFFALSYFKIFHLGYPKLAFANFGTQKKPFDVICCLYKMKQSHWLLCDWSSPGNHATVKLDLNGFPWNENLQRKQNWTAKSTNLKENAGKIKVVFVIRAALWAENLANGWYPKYCWSSENMLEKLVVAAIGFEFWMKGALVTAEICVLCGWWFSNQFDTL